MPAGGHLYALADAAPGPPRRHHGRRRRRRADHRPRDGRAGRGACSSATASTTTTSSASSSPPPTTSTRMFPATAARDDRPRRRAADLRPRARHRRAARRCASGSCSTSTPTGPATSSTTSTSRGAEPPRRPAPSERRAAGDGSVGTGLIGGSIGLALRAAGLARRPAPTATPATGPAGRVELGALDAVGDDPAADLTFVATPVGAVADEARARCSTPAPGRHRRGQREGARSWRPSTTPASSAATRWPAPSRRASTAADRRPVRGRHLGAHPDGDAPTTRPTPPCGRSSSTLGAEVVALAPDRHDALVAVVSHVPHLTAATLMRAGRRAGRGAPGPAPPGRRRVPGHDPHRRRPPRHLARHLRREPRGHRRRPRPSHRRARRGARRRGRRATGTGCCELLEQARSARVNLPARFGRPEELGEMRVPMPDRPRRASPRSPRWPPSSASTSSTSRSPTRPRATGACSSCWSRRATSTGSPTPWSPGATGVVPQAGAASSGRTLTVAPAGPLRGRLRVPGDKSISHRALLLAALAEGRVDHAGPVRRRRRGRAPAGRSRPWARR